MRKNLIIILIALTAIGVSMYYYRFCPFQNPQGQENCERIKRQIKLSVKYKNIYNYPCVISLKVPLLKDWKYRQTVYSSTIQPPPNREIEDQLGNRYIQYDNLTVGVGKTLTVEQQAIISNDALVFNFDRTVWEQTVPNKYKNRATALLNRDYWHGALAASSGAEEKQLLDLAKQITTDQQSRLYKLINIYDFMRRSFAYDSKQAKSSFTEMLKDRHLQCSDAAMLTAKLLQNLDFKVRVVGGMLLSTSEPEDQATHSWCEVFCPNLGYVPVDPTQGRFSYMRQACFAKADPNIIVWYMGDDSRGCALKEMPAQPRQQKQHPSQLHNKSLSVNISHHIINYNSNLTDNRTIYNFNDLFTFCKESISDIATTHSAKIDKKNIPDHMSQAALWALNRRWSEKEIKALNTNPKPAVKLLQAWLAIYSSDWQKAQKLLDELPSDDEYVAEAKVFLAIFTMQSLEVKKQSSIMKKCSVRDFTAEAICQFCNDQRNWQELCSAAKTSAHCLPTDYLLKIQWLRGAFKSNQAQEQESALASLVKDAPQDGYPYLVLGQLYLERGQVDDSLAMLQKAADLNLRPEEKKFVEDLRNRLHN